MKDSPVFGACETAVDRESAYEKLAARAQQPTAADAEAEGDAPAGKPGKPRAKGSAKQTDADL